MHENKILIKHNQLHYWKDINEFIYFRKLRSRQSVESRSRWCWSQTSTATPSAYSTWVFRETGPLSRFLQNWWWRGNRGHIEMSEPCRSRARGPGKRPLHSAGAFLGRSKSRLMKFIALATKRRGLPAAPSLFVLPINSDCGARR